MSALPVPPPPDSRALVAQKQAEASREAERIAKRDAPFGVTPPARIEALAAILERVPGNDCASQRQRIILALEGGQISTHELRKYLDVMAPAARISEIRAGGLDVLSVWARFETRDGRIHRFTNYVLDRA